jgi:outer membrane protein assembly factor BamB
MRYGVGFPVFALAALWAVCAHAQWGQFRGPNGTGVSPADGFPSDLSPATQARWTAKVPFGQSSPVVGGGRVYVTASEGDRLVTLSFDAETGRHIWRREVARTHAHAIYRSNDPASPTPVADAQGVVAFFPDFGLISYASDGVERWRHPLGPFRNFYGMAASPIVVGDLVVLVCDQQAGSFILALDRASGAVKWKRDRPGRTVGWASPIVFRPSSGPPQLVVLGSTHVDGYELGTGAPAARWWMRVASNGGLGTPVTSGDTVLVSTLAATEPWLAAFPSVLEKYDRDKDLRLSSEEFKGDELADHFGWLDDNSDGLIDSREWNVARDMGTGEFGVLAIRPGEATGPLAPTAIRWRFQKNLPFVAAPLIYQDVIYLVRDGGIITTIDPSTGKLLKEGRSKEALGQYFASPVAADGKVYLASSEGKLTVLRAGAQWEVLGVNDFGDEISATPALGDGRIYVRTRSTLYCFGAR